MTQVRFGTRAPAHEPVGPDGKQERKSVPMPEGADHVVAEINIPDSYTFMEKVLAVTTPVRGFWDQVSDEPPVWVSSDDPKLADILAEQYGCPVEKFDHKVTTLLAPADVAKVASTHEAIRAAAAALDEGGEQ